MPKTPRASSPHFRLSVSIYVHPRLTYRYSHMGFSQIYRILIHTSRETKSHLGDDGRRRMQPGFRAWYERTRKVGMIWSGPVKLLLTCQCSPPPHPIRTPNFQVLHYLGGNALTTAGPVCPSHIPTPSFHFFLSCLPCLTSVAFCGSASIFRDLGWFAPSVTVSAADYSNHNRIYTSRKNNQVPCAS